MRVKPTGLRCEEPKKNADPSRQLSVSCVVPSVRAVWLETGMFRTALIIRAKWSLVGSLSDCYQCDKSHYSSAFTLAVAVTLHLHTQLQPEKENPVRRCSWQFKIQLNSDIRSPSQTHNAHRRHLAVLWPLWVGCFWKHLSSNAQLKCSVLESLRPKKSPGSLGLMLIQAKQN